jgi:hypothetical protein
MRSSFLLELKRGRVESIMMTQTLKGIQKTMARHRQLLRWAALHAWPRKQASNRLLPVTFLERRMIRADKGTRLNDITCRGAFPS